MLKAHQDESPWRDADFEHLVAAHLLRDKGFMADKAPLLEKAGGAFFGNFLLNDLVDVAIASFQRTGELLPPPALVAEAAAKTEANAHGYKALCDLLWRIPLDGVAVAGARLVRAVQNRMLAELGDTRQAAFQSGSGAVQAWFRKVREIELLGEDQSREARAVTDDVDSLLAGPRRVVQTGFPALDACMTDGGIADGELFLVIGDPNVGKTQLLHHLARQAVAQGVRTFVLSLETGDRATRMRLLRGFTGWTMDRVQADPEGFKKAVAALGDLPLHVKYHPGGSGYTMSALEADIDRVQQRTGERVGFVVRDYGELMAKEIGTWQDVRRSYFDFKALLGKLAVPGADACQRNKERQISFYDLLKDADIGVTLEEDIPGGPILLLTVKRIREGSRTALTLVVDRATGRIESRGPARTELDPEAVDA